MMTEMELIIELNVILANLETGPLSDTPYSDTSVNADQQLELWEEPNSGWPSASVDTPQLARAILDMLRGTPEPDAATAAVERVRAVVKSIRFLAALPPIDEGNTVMNAAADDIVAALDGKEKNDE